MAPFRPFKGGRRELPLATPLAEAVGGVIIALCPQVMSQAPGHLRSFEKQATCDGCFARQSVCSAISFKPACPGQYTHMSFQKQMSTIDSFQSGLPVPLSVANSSNLRGWWHVWSGCSLMLHASLLCSTGPLVAFLLPSQSSRPHD